jgi:hypothetical protein
MKQILMLGITVLTFATLACSAQSDAVSSGDGGPDGAAAAPPAVGGHSGVVVETMNAANYTYVKVDTGAGEIWAAAPTCEVELGQQLSLPPGMAMENFHSKSLDRDFPLIYFVDRINGPGGAPAESQLPPGHPEIGGAFAPAAVPVKGVNKVADGVTLAELFADKKKLSGSTVTLRGKVVKVNNGIMGRNWLHIQDGSGDTEAGTHDLTVTTADTAEVGATVLVSGTVTLDRDFGAGYRYALIVENATVKAE